jgi:N-acetylglucosaminyl-diphospho-decaprenol L-rhamnosyltransferase
VQVELCIAIVNWNGGHLLRRCIESITKSPPSVPYEIVVVDNASTDDSVSWLRSDGDEPEPGEARTHLIENSENLGFGKAGNQAFAYSDAPLLFLLNNDTEVRAGAINSLIATLRSHVRIGACGPRLVNPDGSLQISAWRNPPAAWAILVSGLRIYRLIPASIRGELLLGRHWNHARRRMVGMLSGAAILVKREVIEDVGGFDERFHMYAEDDEWCLRMARAGWSLVFEPDAVVMHHGGHGASSRWNDLERTLRITDEGLRFQRLCLSRWQVTSNTLANCLVVSLAYVWRRLTGRPTIETRLKLGLYVKYLKRAVLDR